MTIGCERGVEITDRSRGCIILVNSSTNASGERAIGAYKAYQANRKAACFQSYSPQSGHECVNGENLVEMYIIRFWSQDHMENETNQRNHGSSKCAKLIHDCLCCTIWSSCDNPVVSPPGIDDATYGKHNIESEKGPLACRLKWR
jgi:hypothetical protein